MHGQIAVVTGASGGLGSELCRLIAAEGVGLALVDRDESKSKELAAQVNSAFGGIVKGTHVVDLADHADIQRLAVELSANYPRIDYLFNNAGVLTETLQFSGHGNELHFEVNTLAPLQLIDALRASLKAASGAMIVNTSAGISLGAKTLDWDELVKPKVFRKLYGPYVNSKEALNVVSAALSAEIGKDRILIRCADPGPNRTTLTKGAGTPLWMRLFYWALPKPNKGAKKIFDAGFSNRWGSWSGVFISNNKMLPLPAALANREFQQDLLRKCRDRAASTQAAG